MHEGVAVIFVARKETKHQIYFKNQSRKPDENEDEKMSETKMMRPPMEVQYREELEA